MRYQHALCWLRRDLRLEDHAALSAASQMAKHVTVVFLFDELILEKLPAKCDRRLQFIQESLAEVDRQLRKRGSALVVMHGKAWDELPAMAQKLKAEAVFCNRDYEPYAKRRDAKVAKALQGLGLSLHSYKDHVLFEGLEVSKSDQSPYKVFTPYSRQWLKQLTKDSYAPQPVRPQAFSPLAKLVGVSHDVSLARIGFEPIAKPWLKGGAEAGAAALRQYLDAHVVHYEATRNDLLGDGATSQLSTHLRFGTLALRSVVTQLLACQASPGQKSWLRQLIWREFYQMILDQFPHVEKEAFRPEYEAIKWPGSAAHFKAWCWGETGFPLIDAAMRAFVATGWMPNRLRMVTASFLAKDLLVDYRKGEGWFAGLLMDYDKAANNGGWQWSASTGCDAQPYFRVFNPILQSRRFDPQGTFIRKHLPELARLDHKHIHWPSGLAKNKLAQAGVTLGRDYPEPIVDHTSQSVKAVALFKKIKKVKV